MCARVLRESPPADLQARRDMLDAIGEAAEWMDRLIRDLQDVGSIERGRLAVERHTEDVRPIVESAIAMFTQLADSRRVRLAHDVPDGIPPVEGDAGRLVQVLSNLLSNALRHTGEGGSVTVRASTNGGDVLFSVRDTGAGVPPEALPRIFDRHWTSDVAANRGGSGLGLAISRGIVQAHGGRIWVESEPGKGSTFFFTVPVSARAVT
jgi:signal transduction histidine kinase